MAPSSILGISSNILVGRDVRTGKDLLDRHNLTLKSVTGEVNGLLQGGKISIVVAATSVEVVVSNLRDIERVSRAQQYGSSIVTGMRLEDSPSEVVVLGCSVVAVAREVAAEVDRAAEGEDIVLVALGGRALVEHSRAKTWGSVDAAVAEDGGFPALEAGIRRGVAKGAAVQCVEVGGCFALNVDLVVILEVGTNAGQIDNNRDVELLELSCGANTTKLEKLRGVLDELG